MQNIRQEIKIEIKTSDVSNKCLRKIKQTTETVSLLFHLLNNNNGESFPPLIVDGLPIVYDDPEEKKGRKNVKEQSLNWLFCRAFEDFVVGMSESLIEAHKIPQYLKLAKLTTEELISPEELKKRIDSINKKPLKLPFPSLIKEIEAEFNVAFSLKNQVLSINQVRNCLVHRNGVVSDFDINNQEHNSLELSITELIVLSEKDGKIIEVKKEDKEPGFKTNKIGFDTRSKSVFYQLNQPVIIDSSTFNSVSFTCYKFVLDLFEKVNPAKQVS
jgi:hypothetical protein